MKRMRIPLFCAIGITILCIILGSFFDLKLSQAIASPDNGFGLGVSAVGVTIGFCGMTFIGGAFLAFANDHGYATWQRVLFLVIAIGAFGASLYYAGREYFGVNGFYEAAPKAIGYFVAIVPLMAAEFFGYYVFKDCENKNMWIVLLIAIAAIGLALIGFVNVLKSIMHRPRFRAIMNNDIPFYNWWSRNSKYTYYMDEFFLDKEEFKSFPSGHTTEASILLAPIVFLPLANKKWEKYQLPAFICAFCFVLLVGFARILAAAHFLSDVSMGATISLALLIIANEVVIRIKFLHPNDINELAEASDKE